MTDCTAENIMDISFISNISNSQEDETHELSINDLDSSFVSEPRDITIDENLLSTSFEKFIESIGDMLSKSQYILYDLQGNKLCLEKHEVVYESDVDGNRQYYLIEDDSPLFQNISMINEYIEKKKN